jgi:membrane-bound ClpP family serine protease
MSTTQERDSTNTQQDTLSLQQQHEVQRVTSKLQVCLARALIFFSIAWFFLTVGVYTFYALSAIGIGSLVIGVICLIISIINFVRYGLGSRKGRAELRNL